MIADVSNCDPRVVGDEIVEGEIDCLSIGGIDGVVMRVPLTTAHSI